MRINKMISTRKIFDLLPNSLKEFFKEMYGDQFGEFVCGYCELRVEHAMPYMTFHSYPLQCANNF